MIQRQKIDFLSKDAMMAQRCQKTHHVHDSGVPLVAVADHVAGVEVHHHHTSILSHLSMAISEPLT